MEDTLKVWTVEALESYAKTTKDVEVAGGIFKIKKLSASLMEADKQDTFFIIQQGLVEPALSVDQLKQLPADLIIDLAKGITEFSGLNVGDAEKN